MKKRRADSNPARAAWQEREAWVAEQVKKDRTGYDVRAAWQTRAAWRAEVRELFERRVSLLRQIERARRAGDKARLANLEDQRKATLPPSISLPVHWKRGQGSLTRKADEAERQGNLKLAEKLYREAAVEFPKDHEWEKTIPRRLRSATGQAAWVTLLLWRSASESEKRNLVKTVGKFRDPAATVLSRILRCLMLPHSEFLSKLGIAFAEESRSWPERMKERLLWYRANLRWITGGQPRDTIAELQEIVDPYKTFGSEVFGNIVRELKVPHLPAKRGAGSPTYARLAK